MKKIIFINSHPIQYFAPLYKFMNDHGTVVDAWYASEGATKPMIDKEFGVEVKWDIPLLTGYQYRFFKNVSWKPSASTGFFGLINPGMIAELFNIPKSVVIVHGWHYLTHLLIILFGKLAGHTVCVRNETPLSHEKQKTGWKQTVKNVGLRYILFPQIDYFLFIGTQNRLFYKSHNVADHQLIHCPYAVDNDRFRSISFNRPQVRETLNIPAEAKVILYSAKYIDKKRPMDLLRAFKDLDNQACWLVMVGEGELRKKIEDFIGEHQLKNVLLTGFVNQSKIAQYYAISDVFVMCSTVGETWGLSVNEAMNYDLPIVASDLTGCSDDLVIPGENGYVFETGNVRELTCRLQDVLFSDKLCRQISSSQIIEKYSYEEITTSIKRIA